MRTSRRRGQGPPRPRRRLAAALVIVLAAGGIVGGWLGRPRPACQEALIPAYFYPGADWTEAIGSHPPPRVMIMDVTSSGAGTAPDPNYRVVARRAQGAGITLAGYADTDYGRRPPAAVQADVLHYKSWYGVRGIFLDRVSSSPASLAYYRQLSAYIHRVIPGSLVILNPGDYPDPSYMSAGDIIVTFEGSYAQFAALDQPHWAASYPASRFAALIYGTPATQLSRAIATARRRGIGYVYVTGQSGANPYRSLPGYWPDEDSIIAACAG